ncbi:MAG: 3-deoxy-D-manno-octulosonate cytidylyltransferase [Chthoniobacteraceae bacterium]|nr:3-deoxy-D-manno-octulosonate cytidylyltransferase [Chthoniobacteraceae bacterium]
MSAKIAVIIPARYGSTRFPGKPLHLIAGKPLIQHVWERSRQAKGIDAVIVATDDMRIAETAFKFGAKVSITSEKHRSGTDRCAEAAKGLKKFTHFINVQGDEPLIDPILISNLAKTLASEKKISMITAAAEFGADEDVNNPNAVKVVLDRDSNALYFSRSPIPFARDPATPAVFYLKHQGIYGYSRKFLLRFVKWKPSQLEKIEQLEQLRALENGCRIRVLMTSGISVGVDSLADVAVAERLLKEGQL